MIISFTYSTRKIEDQDCRFRQISRSGKRVVLEVTGRCNLSCRHCFACSEQEDLPTGDLLEIISQLPKVDAKKLIITGGEPLLRKDIEVLINAATSLGIGVDLNTNLSAFTLKRAKTLWIAGLREISTSIDGDRKYHDWFRRYDGDFAHTITGIKLAISTGYTVDVHGVCTPDNLSDISQVIDICADLGVDSYTLLAVVSLGKGIAHLNNSEFLLRDEHKRKLWKILEIKREMYSKIIAIRTIDIFKHPSCEECPMGQTVIGITPSGKIMPCLLADYSPTAEEHAVKFSLIQAFQFMTQKLEKEQKRLACSNVAKDLC